MALQTVVANAIPKLLTAHGTTNGLTNPQPGVRECEQPFFEGLCFFGTCGESKASGDLAKDGWERGSEPTLFIPYGMTVLKLFASWPRPVNNNYREHASILGRSAKLSDVRQALFGVIPFRQRPKSTSLTCFERLNE